MITKRQLGIIMPEARAGGRIDSWYRPLVAAMQEYDITSDVRQAMFLAHIAEETGELRVQQENLRYSGQRLREVFPGLFAADPGLADRLAAQGPEAIANYIYDDAHRSAGYKLGNTAPGDGWKYRGRGPMQLTGKDNYRRFFASIGLPVDSDPDVVLMPDVTCRSAAHFWKANGCNEIADSGDFVAATRRVNGGTTNLATRQRYYAAAQRALATPDPQAPPVVPAGYVETSTGNIVLPDVKQSSIVKNADQATKVVTTAGTAAAAVGGAASAFGGMDWKVLAVLGATVLGGLVIYLLWRLLQAKATRIDMSNKGVV